MAERWAQLEALYHEAAGLPEAERAAFLDRVCAGNAELRVRLEALLAHADTSFLDDRPADAAPPLAPRTHGGPRLVAGTRLGPYEIQRLVGEGGMGHVYQARDTRLGRTVAIKVVSSDMAGDPQWRDRFEREARIISTLTHPHICTLHDVGEHPWAGAGPPTPYLVMELLQGETLAERLTKGPLPLAQALTVAIDVASALDAAHRAGIVHRDVKPGNIFLVRTGSSSAPPVAKLLDFGLAKAQGEVIQGATQLPTMPAQITEEGGVLGTCQYMAPEQIEGKEADARADIFAFGCVVFEMLTGRKAFEGQTRAGLIGAILKDAPPLVTQLQPTVPAALNRIVATCLAKDPDDRWQTARDLMRELRWVADGTAAVTSVTAGPASKRARAMAVVGIGLVVVGAAAAGYVIARRAAVHGTSGGRISLSLLPPDGSVFDSLALSPDGKQLAFTATGVDGHTRLWMRPLDMPAAKVFPGTDDAQFPFWSPDRRFVAFVSQGALKRLNVDSGEVEVICSAVEGSRGGSWNRTGTIILEPASNEALFSTAAAPGSKLEPLTRLDADKQETSHRWPSFLPDGHHYLYAVRSGLPSVAGVYVRDLRSGSRTRLLPEVTNATYVSESEMSGFLVFARGGLLLAQRFDPNSLLMSGEAQAVADDVGFAPGFSFSAYSVSQTGALVYTSSLPNQDPQLVWFDRSGRRLSVLEHPVGTTCNGSSLSPNDRYLVENCIDPQSGQRAVWVTDLARRIRSRVGSGDNAVWSPDSSRLMFLTSVVLPADVMLRVLNGSGPERLVLKNVAASPSAWSPDGHFVLFSTETGFSLLAPSAKQAAGLVPYHRVNGPSGVWRTGAIAFSPDGRWIAYESDESGQRQIFVEPFEVGAERPPRAGRWQVSNKGGELPRWRRDGRELFYLSSSEEAVKSVEILHTASAIEPKAPTTLFPVRLSHVLEGEFNVTGDGQRFLVRVASSGSQEPAATVVLNWASRLKE